MGHHKTSMLQDVEGARTLEIDALLGSVVELARRTNTPTPHIDTVYALTKLLAKTSTRTIINCGVQIRYECSRVSGKEILRKVRCRDAARHALLFGGRGGFRGTKLAERSGGEKPRFMPAAAARAAASKWPNRCKEVHEFALKILGMTLVRIKQAPRKTGQAIAGRGGCRHTQGALRRHGGRPSHAARDLMASSEGGMEIEEVAAHHPEKIHKVAIDPDAGLTDAQADDVARKIGVPSVSGAARKFMHGLYRAFGNAMHRWRNQSLIITGGGDVLALDAKFNFDSMRCSGIRKSLPCAIWTRKTGRS